MIKKIVAKIKAFFDRRKQKARLKKRMEEIRKRDPFIYD